MADHHGEVVEVDQLSPHLIRVVLGGEGLAGFVPNPDTDSYVNLLTVPPGAPYSVPFTDDDVRDLPREQQPFARRFTVRRWDAERRRLSIDFVVHGDDGHAGRWASRAVVGDRVQFRGPAGGYTPDPSADWHLFVGDESALPAIAASVTAVPSGVPAVVLIEVDGPDDEIELSTSADLRLTWVHRVGTADEPGPDDPVRLLEAFRRTELPPGRVHAFVHGEAVATREMRRHLLADLGVPREDLSCSPYWRRGFTDEQWRSIKGAWQRDVDADVP